MLHTFTQGVASHLPMIFAITVFVLAIGAMTLEWMDKTLAVLGGAVLLGMTKTTPFAAMIDMIDFTTILLLLGLMLLVEVTRQSQILEWLNVRIVRHTKGNPLLLYVVFSVLTLVLSMFLANATTMMILVPLTITATRGMGIDPKPYIIAEIIFSDLGGAVTIIGDPANVLIASANHVQFFEFSHVMAMPIAAITLLFLAILTLANWQQVKPIARNLTKLFMTHMLAGKIEHVFASSSFNPRFAARTVAIFLAVIVLMVLDPAHLPIEYIALGGAVVLLVSVRRSIDIQHVFDAIDVHTLLFFAGLFILVGSLERTEALTLISDAIALHAHTTFQVSLLTLWTIGLLSAFVENIPLVAIMIPVLQHSIASGSMSGNVGMVWFALSLGACLGGNGSLLGSSANILGAQLAARNGVHISFLEYFKIGYPLTILALAVSSIFLWIIA